MNRKFVLPLILVLVVMMFSSVEFASAEANVGVTVGQTTDNTYGVSRTVRDSDGNLTESMPMTVYYLETLSIQEVSGTNITFKFERDLLNGTDETGTSWINVSDGDGTGVFIIIPKNINANGLLYPDWVNENGTSDGAPCANETVLLPYNGGTLECTHLNFTYTYDDQPRSENYYWEKSTGLIVKWSVSGSETAEDGSVETVNIVFQRVGLEQTFYPYIDTDAYPVTVNSNSTLMGFNFSQTEKQMTLNVTGKTGTIGSSKITFPDGLLWDTFSVTMDERNLVEGEDYTKTYDGTYYTFTIDYIHSSHIIKIAATEAVPEFSAWMTLPLFLAATLLATMLYRKRLNQTAAKAV